MCHDDDSLYYEEATGLELVRATLPLLNVNKQEWPVLPLAPTAPPPLAAKHPRQPRGQRRQHEEYAKDEAAHGAPIDGISVPSA